MFGTPSKNPTQEIGFLLLPKFSMIAFTASIEPLRAANRMSGQELYHWNTLSLDGDRVRASNEVAIRPYASLMDDIDLDVLFVCAGLDAHLITDKAMMGKLRSLARKGVPLGSVCTGSIALADAGLLDNYRCTIHWENIEGFVEAHPDLDVMATLFEIDRDRYTCSGGTAPLDMMIHSIALDHGEALAFEVAEQMLHSFVRKPNEQQRTSIQHRTGISNAKLLAAIGVMEAHIDPPLPLPRIAKRINLSLRQLERLFKSQLSNTPTRYYLELRLQRAKQLIAQTSMTMLEIAVATGFTSAAHFTQAYKKYFGHPPSQERRKS
jgi:transcriptional regulator GlxA family with amidase domain